VAGHLQLAAGTRRPRSGGGRPPRWPASCTRTNMADLLHADGQRDAAMAHLKEAARRFASVDVGDAPRPEIWTLVEW